MNKKFLLLMIVLLLQTLLIIALWNDKTESPVEIKQLSKDQSKYNPGERVEFRAKMNDESHNSFVVHYYYKGRVIESTTVEQEGQWLEWTWTPPNRDHQGYLVEVKPSNDKSAGKTIAVDVSSSWTAFPRYGFLSKFHTMEEKEQQAVINRLSRYHINALQFYDWHDEHHQPLKMNHGKPLDSWSNIASEPVDFQTIDHYIDLAHQKGMQAMAYNLLYGTLSGAEQDGVLSDWYVYKDKNADKVDRHPLPDSWKSDIFLTNPSNSEWQDYIFQRQQIVYQALPFDGWHIDQLGNRGDLYKASGLPISMKQSYQHFLEAVKAEFPDHSSIMNAVNQYGQEEISNAGVPFLYTEVWDPITTYGQLKDILIENKQNWNKNTVLAAYMNYDRANQEGVFNLPGVLFTDALIFAHGGAHIELGEHMLAKEYFPNDHLTMTKELKERLVHYYDFMVGYQNLLRGDELSPDELVLTSDKATFSSQPEKGAIYAFSKKTNNKKIVQLLNFTDVEHMNWRDPQGTQKKPETINNVPIQMDEKRKVEKVWMASPDWKKGVPKTLEFKQKDGQLSFTLPHLEYWDMIAIEYK